MKLITFAMFLNYVSYSLISVGLLALFTWVYIRVTPYDEFKLIKEGSVGSAISLVGAMIGFTLPLLTASFHGVSLFDFILWSGIAGAVQLSLFFPVYRAFDSHLHENVAAAIVYAGICVVVGLVSAFSLIPF